MKKTKLTRKLMAACSVVALSAVMYGCTGSGGDEPVMDDPPPPAAAVDLMGSTDLMPGMTTVAAGASVTVGNTTLTCSDDADCVVTVMQDDVTGSFTATATGGMVTVTVAVAEPPPPPPTVYTVDLMGSTDLMAGMTTIPAGTSMPVGDTTLTCDGTEDCVLTVAEDSVTGGFSATSTGGTVTVAIAETPPPPTVYTVDLMGSTDLGVGDTTIPAGTSMDVGDTTLTCDGTEDCVLTVAEDSVTGGFSATSTGGTVTVAIAETPPPPTVYTVDLMGSTDLGVGDTTIPAGTSMDVGDTTLSCDGTEDCVLTVAEDSVTGGFSATSTGGTVTVAIAEPPTPPTVYTVDLMGSPDLMPATRTIAAGESVEVGDTTVTCPAGVVDCVLTVARDALTGQLVASSSGAQAEVAYNPPPTPTVHIVNLPEDHGLGVGTTTLQPGDSHKVGRTIVTCPLGGDPCKLEVKEDPVTMALTATSTGSMAIVSIESLAPGLAALQAFGGALKATATPTGTEPDNAMDEPTLRPAFAKGVRDGALEDGGTPIVADAAGALVEAGITMSYATHGSGQSLVEVVPEVTNPSTGDPSNRYAGGATAPTGANDDEQDEIDETMAKISVAERVPNHTISTDTDGNAAEEWEVEGDPGDTLSKAVSGGRTLTVDFISDYETDNKADVSTMPITIVDGERKWANFWFAEEFFNGLGVGQERIIPENTGGAQANHPAPLHGTLNGIPGMFSCGATACTIDRHHSNDTLGVDAAGGALTFTPYGNDMEHEEFVDDTDWLVAGSWMINPADNETGNFEFGAFAYGGDPFVTENNGLDLVVGDAKYEGSATGRYARSVGDDNDQGLFSADVSLEASFEGGTGTDLHVEGELSGFMLGDNTTTENWALSLEMNNQDWDGDETLDDPANAAGVFGGDLSGTADNHTIEGAWWGRFFGNDNPGMVANPVETGVRMIDADQPGSVAGVFSGTDSTGADYSLTLGGAYMADWESGTHPAP